MHDNRTGKGRCHERCGDGSGRSTHESPVNESMEINLFPNIGNEPILLLHILFTNSGFSIANIAMEKKNSHPEHGYVLAMLSFRKEAEATTEILIVG